MKKIIILFFILMPITAYGQVAQTDSLSLKFTNNSTSASMLVDASNNLSIGLTLSLAGIAVPSACVLFTNNKKSNMLTAGYIIGASATIAGIYFMYKGYRDIGKAGARLEYELGAMNSKIALKF